MKLRDVSGRRRSSARPRSFSDNAHTERKIMIVLTKITEGIIFVSNHMFFGRSNTKMFVITYTNGCYR